MVAAYLGRALGGRQCGARPERLAEAAFGVTSVPVIDVWLALGGGELRHGRGRAFWRHGDGLNVSLDSDKQVFYDFATRTGGGALRLVETAAGCGRREALAWLEARGFIERREWTADERRTWARRRARAERLGEVAACWQRGAVQEFEHAKRSAYDAGDFTGLAYFAGELERVRGLAGAALVECAAGEMQADATQARRRIAAAREDQSEAVTICAVVMNMLDRRERRGIRRVA
jgi:hypothetical protein